MVSLRSLCVASILLLPVVSASGADRETTFVPAGQVTNDPLGLAKPAQPANATRTEPELPPAAPIPQHVTLPKVRGQCPIRLGGVFLRGLGDETAKSSVPRSVKGTRAKSYAAKSPASKVGAKTAFTSGQSKLSNANRDWVAANCDVAAFSRTSLQPDTFRVMRAAHPLFTPLLYVYASTLYEQADHKGNAGGWRTEMQNWTLRDVKGVEVAHPDKGGHWMDFGDAVWAAHWRAQVAQQVGQYGAQGVVAAELPIGNTFVPAALQKYKTTADRLKATTQWLDAARSPEQFMLIPSAIGFDSVAGHATLPTPPGTREPELPGRVWDEMYPLVGGAWAEGWVTPYWSGVALPDAQWELHIEAADRADRSDQVMIACAAYHNDDELEYVLASFLMAYHAQGRLCLQPMPLRPGQSPDAGYDLNAFRREIAAKSAYFNAPLGQAQQERHPLRVDGGDIWRRQFQGGDVYVNSDDNHARTIHFGGWMRRLNGKRLRDLTLPPHHGAILISEADE